VGQTPRAVVEDSLRVLGSAGLVTAPEIALGQVVEEKEPTQYEESEQ
jgi:hypothetical protein